MNRPTRILVTGAGGQVGVDLVESPIDLDGYRAALGFAEETDPITFHDLQERRELIRRRLEQQTMVVGLTLRGLDAQSHLGAESRDIDQLFDGQVMSGQVMSSHATSSRMPVPIR